MSHIISIYNGTHNVSLAKVSNLAEEKTWEFFPNIMLDIDVM